MKKAFGKVGSPVLPLAALALFAVVPARAQSGAALFKAKCAPCHGPDGKGNTSMGKMLKVKDLGSAEVQKKTNAELTAIIENGKSPMPGYKDKLSTGEIKELVSFIRSLKK